MVGRMARRMHCAQSKFAAVERVAVREYAIGSKGNVLIVVLRRMHADDFGARRGLQCPRSG